MIDVPPMLGGMRQKYCEENMELEYTITDEDYQLHALSFENQKLLRHSSKCGCFCCGEIFSPREIEEWINDKNGKTAVCPYCGIDSVIPESENGQYELNEELLQHMNEIWF